MTAQNSSRPGVLMLGIVHHAKPEFEKLSEVADVTVSLHIVSQWPWKSLT